MESEKEASRRSQEIYDEIFRCYDAYPSIKVQCPVKGCSGWDQYNPFFSSKPSFEACHHRKCRAFETCRDGMVARDIYKCEKKLGYFEAEKRRASQEKKRQWEEKAGHEAARQMQLLGEGPNGFPYMVGNISPPSTPSEPEGVKIVLASFIIALFALYVKIAIYFYPAASEKSGKM
ncbi:hypothetical protein AGABI1DRAFT_131085 [Agaricus bisporus var. burnettii JB137-S8]|uniref:Uncharacterized protein n=1 Tax=Agaricus bisporus var. burnettii (strain JB137-S8 / ATCC MYA-4627 / FGSC 10392) TaxID=597362 RepID=K5X1L0_AGABU|nr:uncharacterized protein AGABI1DRAFT_131085 [Agaricus bisporus var. burnettii JB137-S8]EKM76797.1 hypothetical protein AGABI1DRAFT_131085 [Agaricus bisporus var. burnettii JB137-S8]